MTIPTPETQRKHYQAMTALGLKNNLTHEMEKSDYDLLRVTIIQEVFHQKTQAMAAKPK